MRAQCPFFWRDLDADYEFDIDFSLLRHFDVARRTFLYLESYLR